MKSTALPALLIILHGSPRPDSDHPARKLTKLLQTQGKFRAVMIGYLECQQPSIPEAVMQLAELGVSQIIAVPYLLHSGRHLVFDIPEKLREGASKYLDLEIIMGEAVGQSKYVASAMLKRGLHVLD